jgi:SOS-response transcriptional repressor LexA
MANDDLRTREAIFNILVKYKKETGFTPTQVEIAKMLGLKSHATVNRHLKILRDEGRIFFIDNRGGTIQILDNGPYVQKVNKGGRPSGAKDTKKREHFLQKTKARKN